MPALSSSISHLNARTALWGCSILRIQISTSKHSSQCPQSALRSRIGEGRIKDHIDLGEPRKTVA